MSIQGDLVPLHPCARGKGSPLQPFHTIVLKSSFNYKFAGRNWVASACPGQAIVVQQAGPKRLSFTAHIIAPATDSLPFCMVNNPQQTDNPRAAGNNRACNECERNISNPLMLGCTGVQHPCAGIHGGQDPLGARGSKKVSSSL